MCGLPHSQRPRVCPAPHPRRHHRLRHLRLRLRHLLSHPLPTSPLPRVSCSQVRNTFDAETEAALNRWVACKRKQDYEKADEIRAELAAKGINAALERPAKKAKEAKPAA